MTPTPELVRPDELPAAFRLLFQHSLPAERESRTANALGLVRRGELDPQGLFVMRDGGALLGAVFCLPVPGAGALVWPPQCVPGEHRPALEDALLRHASGWLRARHVKAAQALLSAEEARFADALPRNGFAHVAALWFMRHDLSSLAAPHGSRQCAWTTGPTTRPTPACFIRRFSAPTRARSIVPN